MELKIYSQQAVLKATVSPADSSTHSHELMGDNVVNLSFTSPEYIALDINDYIEVEGVRYTLRTACEPEQKSTLEYVYNVKFEGRESETQRVRMLHTTDGDFEPKFSLYETPLLHIEKVIGNLNRISGSGEWVVGTVIDAPKQNIEYSNMTCAEALAKIAETFETEWWIEGNTLNLCRCEIGEPVELGYMQGLTGLNRADNDNVPFFTRLIPLGGIRNIVKGDYGFTRLQLPDRAQYVEQNAAEYGLYEAVEESAFAHIYPRRIGTVTAVRSEERTGDNGKFTVYLFKDATLTFNPNDYDMPDLVKQVTFGEHSELNGRDFEIVDYYPASGEFEIKTQYPTEDTQLPGGNLIPKVGDEYVLWNMKMPQEYITAAEQEYKEAVDAYLAKYSEDTSIYRGDTDYIHVAEQGIALRIGRRVRLLSPQFFKQTGSRDSRITKVTRNLNNLGKATIECTNAVGKGRMAAIESDVSDIKTAVAEKLDNTLMTILRSWDSGDATDANVFSALRTLREILNNNNKLKDLFLRKDAPDETKFLLKLLGGLLVEKGLTTDDLIVSKLAKMLNAHVDGKLYVDTIESNAFTEGALGSGLVIRRDPNTGRSYIEVDELFVRLKATFRELVIEKLSHVGGEIILSPARMKCVKVESFATYYRCYFETNDGEKEINQEFVAGDQARAQTFNIKPGTYQNVSNRYYWRYVVAVGDNYIDLSRTDCDTNSDIPQAGDDICQLGNRTNPDRQNAIVLSSHGSDAPSNKQYAGINGYILAGKEVSVTSPKGNKYKGDFFLTTGQTVESGIAEAKQKAEEALAQLTETLGFVSAMEDTLEEVKRQADGAIESWFYNADPTMSNAPAKDWTTTALKNVHLGDLYYNTTTGKAFRFQLSGSTYSWSPITDTDVTKALANAQKAQDTADGKRRVFVIQPPVDSAYDVGDLWVNATYSTTYTNELLKCKTAKAAGAAFNISHWEKAAKYTDDTTANKAVADAAAADTKAGSAQSTANAAKNRLDTWADDGVISPSEKVALRTDQANIRAEKLEIVADATKYTVNATAYVTAYTAYDSDLTYYTNATPENITVLATFATRQAAYYSARTALLEAIAAAAKAYAQTVATNAASSVRTELTTKIEAIPGQITLAVAESKTYADNAVNNLQIGGRNLAVGTDKITPFSVTNGVSGTSFATASLFQNLVLGTWYIISFDAKLIAGDGKLHVEFNGSKGGNVTVDSTAWKRYGVLSSYYQYDRFYFWLVSGNGSGEIQIRNIKIEVGNKATDWTPAPEDVDASITAAKDAADAAQGTADTAKANASTANSLLADIASDNKMTAEEKQRTKKEWDAIVSEYTKNTAQATAFGLTHATYTGTYNTLDAYITPLLTSLTTTSDIVGTTFRSRFKSYYDARLDLLNKIATEAKRLADNAQTAANNALSTARSELAAQVDVLIGKIDLKTSKTDFNALGQRVADTESSISLVPNKIELAVKDIQIGGKNLMPNSANIVPFSVTTTASKIIAQAGKWFSNLVSQEKYMISFDAKLIAGDGRLHVEFWGSEGGNITINSSTFTRYGVVSRYKGTTTLYMWLVSAAGEIQIRNIKIEVGNKATDWTPAPEDYIEEVKAGITITSGAVNVFGKALSLAGMVAFSAFDSSTQNLINAKASSADLSNTTATAKNDLAVSMGYASYADLVAKAAAGKTLINGGYIRTELINADGLNVRNSVMENVRITGSLRNPFSRPIDSFDANYNDNISVSGGGSLIYAYSIPWDIGQSGRRICVVNYKWNGSLSTGACSVSAPAGKYFFEDGIEKTSLKLSREVVDLIGYGDGTTFYGWIVMRRLNIMTEKKYGRSLNVLAQGKVTYTSSGVTMKHRTFDGTVLSVSRSMEGTYGIYNIPASWNLMESCIVMLTGCGSSYGASSVSPIKATLAEIVSTGAFTVYTSDDATRNDGSFFFQVINIDDWS